MAKAAEDGQSTFLDDEERWKALAVRIYALEQQSLKLKLDQDATEAQLAAYREQIKTMTPVEGFDPTQAVGDARRAQMEARRAAARPQG